MLGLIAIGNATLIAIEDGPILATDPWFGQEDEAYFGSWGLSYTIPERERELIRDAKYHWYSHGHPDHLNPHSVERFRGKKILLPDHVGARIKTDLVQRGFDVTVLKEREWVELSSRIRVMSISDYKQDATLLVDINGRLFVNMNDAEMLGCRRFIRGVAGNYDDSYLLKLSGYGDADMINIFDEEGNRVEPYAARKPVVGAQLSTIAKELKCRAAIPFSSFHRYQRTDSLWAQEYTTPVEAYLTGFDHRNVEYVPPFIELDCTTDGYVELNPPEAPHVVKSPEDFGDNWTDELEPEDRRLIDEYFLKKEPLTRWYGFLKFVVGGKTHTLSLSGPKDKGITFEGPRHSLMLGIRYEVFDDLLIGNFMKTTFHNINSLYEPPFAIYVPRIADNAGAQSEADVDRYMAEYAARAGGEWLLGVFEETAKNMFRRYVSPNSTIFTFGRRVYRRLRPR